MLLPFLKANIGTILIIAALVCIVGLIIARMIINRRRGRSSCGCGCSGCAMRDLCHESKSKKD
jgi:hypothetical protein